MNVNDSAADASDQPHRPHFGDHDLRWCHGHDKQVLDGAVLALADQRAPVRMMDSMVTLLMISISAPNQAWVGWD